MEAELMVRGIHCRACEMLVKDVCSDFSEITSCSVDIKSGEVVIEHGEGFDIAKLKTEIENLGDYKVTIL